MGTEKYDKDAEIIDQLRNALRWARQKHPDFAEGQYQALGYLGEEYGEVVKEITKGEDGWRERMCDELIDLICVAVRMLRGEFDNKEAENVDGK